MLIENGIPAKEDIRKVTPSKERFAKGPVVIVECFQKIPCDPCVKACKQGAITMPEDINDIPVVDLQLCNGCGVCISLCPGLAIFVVDMTYSKNLALVQLPYEYLPLPREGEMVTALNRSGDELGFFEVKSVNSSGKINKTHTVSIAVPQELAMETRDIRVKS